MWDVRGLRDRKILSQLGRGQTEDKILPFLTENDPAGILNLKV